MMGGDFTWLGPNPGIHGWAMATAAVVSASSGKTGKRALVMLVPLCASVACRAVPETRSRGRRLF